MSEWTPLIAGNQRACPTVREQRSALNDILHAAWAMEPWTAGERREIEALEREVLDAAGRTAAVVTETAAAIGLTA